MPVSCRCCEPPPPPPCDPPRTLGVYPFVRVHRDEAAETLEHFDGGMEVRMVKRGQPAGTPDASANV